MEYCGNCASWGIIYTEVSGTLTKVETLAPEF